METHVLQQFSPLYIFPCIAKQAEFSYGRDLRQHTNYACIYNPQHRKTREVAALTGASSPKTLSTILKYAVRNVYERMKRVKGDGLKHNFGSSE
jgi:hypothetical protein